MKKTTYTIKKEESGLLTVLDNGKVFSLGFNDPKSALQSIWVLNGSIVGTYYNVKFGKVFLIYKVPFNTIQKIKS